MTARLPKDSARSRLPAKLAERLRCAREELTARWLERIAARVAVSRHDVFPTEELLNHVPLLIDGIASYLSAGEDIDADAPVTAKARELGAMRYAQGFDAHQILKEHEFLGAIISSYLLDIVDQVSGGASSSDVAACWHRIAHAVAIIQQATTGHFLQLAAERVNEREQRLRQFNVMVTHELKNHVSAIRGASAMLGEEWLQEQDRARFVKMVSENAQELQRVLENLVQLSRLEVETRQQRNVLLPHAAAEAARQLRAAAAARGVVISVSPELPAVEVNAAAVELCLGNYISNAVKYSDPAQEARWVEVTADLLPPGVSAIGGELVVRVRDNGLGVPGHARAKLFQQFYRAPRDTVSGVEGTGLGLSIVRETVEALGGRAWAEFSEAGGSTFAFSLPSRREEDAAAAGVTRAV